MAQGKKKEFAKTFDGNLDAFVVLKGQDDTEPLGELRFIQAQVNMLSSKTERVSRLLSHAETEGYSAQGLRRLSDIEKKTRLLSTRFSLSSVLLSEIEKSINSYNNSLRGLAPLDSSKLLADRVGEIERIEGESRTYNFKNLFMDMAEIANDAERRINRLEGMNAREGKGG